MGELAARGLPDAAVYTIPELIEIVFKTQGLLMAANRSVVRLMDAKEHDWFGPRDGRSSPHLTGRHQPCTVARLHQPFRCPVIHRSS
ncbi:MAG: hypothetical protein DLM67_00790 [Candidatus Nephthysia bennettiae]|nr:MAG: hypothetical protein DLM67_00790 [Candidatus Dormibacteraeota bacterium]